MSAEDILTYLRLSRHDSHQFGRYLPRLHELAREFDDATRAEVLEAIEKVWDGYFPLGEELDLANGIAGLLYAMDEFALSLDYFARSIEIYGRDTGTLCNMAACHHMIGQDEPAAALLQIVLAHEPGHQGAAELAASLSYARPSEAGWAVTAEFAATAETPGRQPPSSAAAATKT